MSFPSLPTSPVSPSSLRPRFSIDCEHFVDRSLREDDGTSIDVQHAAPRRSVKVDRISGSKLEVASGSVAGSEKEKGLFGSRLRRVPSPLADHRKSSFTSITLTSGSQAQDHTQTSSTEAGVLVSSFERQRPDCTRHGVSSASLPEIKLLSTSDAATDPTQSKRNDASQHSTPSSVVDRSPVSGGHRSAFGGLFSSGSNSGSSSAVASGSGPSKPIGLGLGGEGKIPFMTSSPSSMGLSTRKIDRPSSLKLHSSKSPSGSSSRETGEREQVPSRSESRLSAVTGSKTRMRRRSGEGRGIEGEIAEMEGGSRNGYGEEGRTGSGWVPVKAEFSDENGMAVLVIREAADQPRMIDLTTLQYTSISTPHRSLYLGRHVLVIRDIPVVPLDTGYRHPGQSDASPLVPVAMMGGPGGKDKSTLRSSLRVPSEAPATGSTSTRNKTTSLPVISGGRPVISPRSSSVVSASASSSSTASTSRQPSPATVKRTASFNSGTRARTSVGDHSATAREGRDAASFLEVEPLTAKPPRSRLASRNHVQEMVLSFPDVKARDGWRSLLRSFARLELRNVTRGVTGEVVGTIGRMTSVESLRSARHSRQAGESGKPAPSGSMELRRERIARRLEITVLDAGKLVLSNPEESPVTSSPSPGTTMTFMKSISMGFDDFLSRESSRGRETTPEEVYATPELLAEIHVDGRLMARTSRKSDHIAPLWSEDIILEDLPPSEQCTVNLVQVDGLGEEIVVGSVDLRLADFDIGSVYEKRHLLRSEVGDIVGEIRLRIRREELSIERARRHAELQKSFFAPRIQPPTPGTEDEMSFITSLPGCASSISRIAAANGRLQQLLFGLIESEPPAPAATLFRSNSTLTRLLETTMRLYASDFVNLAVGPVVREICEKQVAFSTFSTAGQDVAPRLTREREVVELYGYVSRLWRSIFDARESFPSFLRLILSRIVDHVARDHAESRVQEHAVASFVFLRLISPSIMWPHLHGIVPETPATANLKALQIVAKPLMNLAFSVEYKDSQDSYLRFFKPFGVDNADFMRNFLQVCSTSCPVWEQKHHPSRELSHYLTGRKSALPGIEAEAIPTYTTTGWVDVARELASVKERKVSGSLRSRASFESDVSRKLPAVGTRASEDSTGPRPQRLEARSASTIQPRRRTRPGDIDDADEDEADQSASGFDMITMAELLRTPPPPPYESMNPPRQPTSKLPRTKSILTSLRSPNGGQTNGSGRKASSSAASTRSSVDSESSTSPHPSLALGRAL